MGGKASLEHPVTARPDRRQRPRTVAPYEAPPAAYRGHDGRGGAGAREAAEPGRGQAG